MNPREIADIGILLADELEQIAAQYHVKSDWHEILVWEADIIKAKSKDLLEKCGLNDNLQKSTLLSEWGESLAQKIPGVASKVRAFHVSYAGIKNCT